MSLQVATLSELYPTPPASRVGTPLYEKGASGLEKQTSRGTAEANIIEEGEEKYPQIDRQQIATMIINKQYIIVYRDAVYNLTEWADIHPGGKLAILHMVGRDATAQINAYHDTKIEARMKKFKIGNLRDIVWDSLIPPIHLGWNVNAAVNEENRIIVTDPSLLLPNKKLPYAITEKDLEPQKNEHTSAQKMNKENKAYNELNAKLRSLGLYKAKPLAYMYDIARYVLLASVCIAAYRNGNWLVSALALGFLWQQLVFAVHDAGHLAITGKYNKDTAIGCGIASFLGGLSVLWWKHNHNVHHIVCNDIEHDPDVQHVPFMAISSKFYDDIHSSYYSRRVLFCSIARTMIPLQHMCYYLIMSLARFNLYVLSYGFLIKEKKTKFHYIEIAGVLVFWTWYSLLMAGLPDWSTRVLYTLASHMVTGILHVQITLSHFGMPTNHLGSRESYASLQLRTTMDVDCPWYLDFFHGGLQNQVSHHLFPRVPKHNLPEVKILVQEFAKANDLPYTMHTFSKGNGVVLSVLKDVANQVSLLAEVAKAGAEGKIVIELDGF